MNPRPTASRKVVAYLDEAHAHERALVSVLMSQIAMTPRGSYCAALETHLRETRDHADRVGRRRKALGGGSGPLGLAETVAGQALALGKTPFDMLRGSGGEEMMLERITRELPKLTDAVVRADVKGEHSFDIAETGAADAARATGREAASTARKTTASAKRQSRQARKVLGVARTEGRVKRARAGVVATAEHERATPDRDPVVGCRRTDLQPAISARVTQQLEVGASAFLRDTQPTSWS